MKVSRLHRFSLALVLGMAVAGSPALAQKSAKQAECRPADTGFFRDEALAIKVSTKLQFNKALLRERIEVKVAGGIVTLSGNVSSQDQIALAGKVAAEAEGVQCVKNFLKVGPPEPHPALGGGQ